MFDITVITEHTLSLRKTLNPDITEVLLRSDNAGCYHGTDQPLPLPSLGKPIGVKISHYDYSNLRQEKISATVVHMQQYINEGNVKSLHDMKKAIICTNNDKTHHVGGELTPCFL